MNFLKRVRIFFLLSPIILCSCGDSTERKSTNLTTDDLIHKGDSCFDIKLYEDAYNFYHSILLKDTTDARGLRKLGRVKSILKENDSAEYYCKRAISIDPKLPMAHYYLGPSSTATGWP